MIRTISTFCLLGAILCMALSWSACIPASHKIDEDKLKVESAEKQYTWAMNNFYAVQYEEAIHEFSKLIENYPESPLKADAQYMIGRCYFAKGQYLEATYQFKLFISNFPDHMRAREANHYLQESIKRMKQEPPAEPVAKPAEQQFQAPPLKESTSFPRIKAAQILLLNSRNLDEVESEIINMRRAGIDTLILRVFQNDGDRPYRFIQPQVSTGVYFKTSRAPLVADILDPVVRIAHQYGMRVFAWMTTRYCDWLTTRQPELREYEYDLETRSPKQTRGLNIFNPVVQAYLIGIYKDLARYQIDGILFQDDLILRQTEGISPEADAVYYREFGRHLQYENLFPNIYQDRNGKYRLTSNGYTEEFWNWAQWKNTQLLNLAQKIMTACKSSNPRIKVALNLYYEAALQPRNALAWLSQDIAKAKTYGFDYFSMMAYHRQIQKELNLSPARVQQLIGEITRKMIEYIETPERVLMKVQTIDWDTRDAVPASELIAVFETILREGNTSLAYIPHNERLLKPVIQKVYQ